MKTLTGVYKLYWEQTPHYYIGQSVNMHTRYNDHIRELKNGKHINKQVQYMYTQYGLPNIEYLCECLPSELDKNEIFFINLEDVHCLNKLVGGNIHYGEFSARAKYSDESIIQAFNMLYDNPGIPHKEVAMSCSIDVTTVHDISACRGRGVHLLKEHYLDKWNILLSRKAKNTRGTRELQFIHRATDERYTCVSGELSTFCRKFGIESSNLSKVINGTRIHTLGWELVYDKNI